MMRFSFGWLVLGLASLFCQRIHAQQLLSVAQTDTNNTIPFQLKNNFLILVEGRIGDVGPLKFILDTGFTHTIVDARAAGNLPLVRQKGKVLNFDKYVPVDWTELPEIQLGPLRAQHVPVMVGDLKQYSELAAGVDVIIGLDLLRVFQSVRVDYRRSLLTFKTSDPGSFLSSGDVSALVVQFTIQGQPVRLILDTGLQGILLYTDRFRKHHLGVKLNGPITRGHEGRLAGEQVMLSGIHFGRDELQAPAFFIPAAPNLLPADIDGYVAPNILGAQMIELDFAANTIRWQ
jgi:predicted aspartyl protease